MDEMLRDETVHPADADPPGDRRAEQEVLPFDRLPPVALPYPEDDLDEPVGFTLTARARREVAPQDLPPLSVVADGAVDDGALERPGDTRPARARALRRAGVGVEDIARQLGVEDLVVRAWVADVAGRAPSPRAPDPRPPDPHAPSPRTPSPRTPSPRADAAGGSRVAPSGGAVRGLRAVGDAEVAGSGRSEDRDAQLAFDLARAAATEEARGRLREEPGFAVGVGMLAAVATFDRHGVTWSTDRADLAASLVSWLRAHAALRVADLRVVLRLGLRGAGDVERHRWAETLAVPLDRVSYTRRSGRDGDGVEALLRVHDPTLAATVAGWIDAALHPEVDPAGVAF